MMNPIDPESLIYRFAKQLEFGPATMQVASEAVRIVQRMNRDWMTTGRRPAGICGAALILAARMNNFRRTVREVVYVVKVTEITINQRLHEFSSTESGELTVDQFRSVQLENTHDPPAFTKAKEGRKPGRSKSQKAPETAAEIEDSSEVDPQEPSTTTHPKRVDADGFAIPDLPVDPEITKDVDDTVSEVGEEKAKRGRPKGSKRKPLPAPSADQVASEEALEDEMTALLAKDSTMVESAGEPQKIPVSDSAEIDETEFESDPEVRNCLLSAPEVEIKEMIWVTENKDYLRDQQAKALKRALTEALRPGGTKPRKRRRGRLGDVTYLEGDGEDEDGRSSRASTPAEATRRMLEHRGFSKKINYRLLETLFGDEEEEKAKPEMLSRSRSRSQSVASRRSASIEPEVARKRPRLLTPSATAAPAASPAPSGPSTRTPFQQTVRAEPTSADKAKNQAQHPNETVLGPAPGANNNEPEDPDDEYDDDEYEEEDDHVDDAFAGRYMDYYDDESDYGSD